MKVTNLDTGRALFGASLSRISLCVLLLFTISYHQKMLRSILVMAGTNCMAASVNTVTKFRSLS